MTAYIVVMWTFFGLVGVTLLVGIILVLKDRLRPFDVRKKRVRNELRKNESSLGSTSILSAVGVSDEVTRNIASEEGFEWSGYSGRSNRRLNFQRRLPPSNKADH